MSRCVSFTNSCDNLAKEGSGVVGHSPYVNSYQKVGAKRNLVLTEETQRDKCSLWVSPQTTTRRPMTGTGEQWDSKPEGKDCCVSSNDWETRLTKWKAQSWIPTSHCTKKAKSYWIQYLNMKSKTIKVYKKLTENVLETSGRKLFKQDFSF